MNCRTAQRANFKLTDALHKPRSEYVPLHPEQARFLHLHKRTRDMPTRWQWHFGSSMLRAHTDAGYRATINAEHFAELVAAGFMRRSGYGAVITEKGRAAQ